MTNPSRWSIAALASALAVLFILVGNWLAGEGHAARVMFDRGGIFGAFSIQNAMWLAFFLGLGELYFRYRQLLGYEGSLRQGYLPADPQILLTPADMPAIYRQLAARQGELEDLIRALVLRFQAGHSVEQTHAMLDSQLELWQYHLDVRYALLRYLVWLIPTLGFLGTVVGIALALDPSQMDLNNPELLQQLTAKLGMAFYTTMVALALSAVLVFIMHLVQGREEAVIHRSGKYCIEHFISRLYMAPDSHKQ